MNIDDVFGSKNLKASDIAKPIKLTIAAVDLDTFGEGADAKQRPLISFRGAQKKLVCNRTNAATITHLAGSKDTDKWVGTEVLLVSEMVNYQGSRVPAIRVRDPHMPAAESDAIPF